MSLSSQPWAVALIVWEGKIKKLLKENVRFPVFAYQE